MEKLKMRSLDNVARNVEKIGELFPNAVTEVVRDGKVERAVDFEVLRQELSDVVVDGREERYQFTWPDKKKAILAANAPVPVTLRPVVEESVGRGGAAGGFDSENLYIEGDNLEVLKLLRETYLGKVKMIYIDPPYNTGNDFIYSDDFSEDKDEYMENSGQFDEEGNRMTPNLESNGRFHTDWLNMIYPRLKVAKDILRWDGAIFISIDDNEQENLKKVCDEIFGESNYVGKIAIVNNLKGRNDRKDIATCHEYLLIYGESEFVAGGLPLTEEQRQLFDKTDENGNAYQLRDLRKRGRPDRREDRPNMYFPIYYNERTKECSLQKHNGWVEIFPLRGDGSDGRWRWGRERVQANLSILEPYYSRIAGRWGIQHRVYLNPALNPANDYDEEEDRESEGERSSKSKSFWIGGELSSDVGRRQLKNLFGTAYFDYPKSVDFIAKALYLGTDSDAIVMDFFSGSATTAHAVMQLNAEDGGKRKFIMVQIPEACAENSEAFKAGYKNVCEIGKERIRRAGRKIKEECPLTTQELDIGFRCLRLDTSNMKDVYYRPDELGQAELDGLIDNMKEDRTPEDLLFQVMLELGAELSSKIEDKTLGGKKVFCVEDNYIAACFDKEVTDETVKAMAKMKPQYAVLRDNSMKSDSVAVNFEQIFKTYSSDTKLRVL